MADVMSDVGFVGAVVEPIDDERSKLFGACFAVLDPRLMMTADHVVEGALERGATRLHVLGPGLAPVPVISILRDPVADVAVLVVERSDVHPFREFGEVEVGAAVSLFAASAQQRLTTSITGREHLIVESSARSRGTDPVPPCARTIRIATTRWRSIARRPKDSAVAPYGRTMVRSSACTASYGDGDR